MRVYRFLVEDEQSDKRYRAQAQSFFNKLVSFVRSHKKYPYKKITEGYWEGSLTLLASKVDPNYSDLLIVFTLGKPFYGAMGPNKNGLLMALSILDNEFDRESIAKNIDRFRTIFIHEMQHYYDASRWSQGYSDFVKKARQRDLNKKGRSNKEYYNNPFEFNAHYQEAIHKFINILSKSVKEKTFMVSHFVPESAQRFIMLMKKVFFNKEFIANLTPENTRKIDKRLYKLYDRIKHLRDNANEVA
jgi:hypothetical protein